MFELAKHRIIEISGSKLVALPKKWTENKQLTKGDEVSCLLNQRGNLVIKPVED